MLRQGLICATILLISGASIASEPASISPELSATCQDAALITFWGSTAHLSERDRARAATAKKDAQANNLVRPAIPASIIQGAEAAAASSHGNAGEGLTDFEIAREDAIAAALLAYESCLEGKLECEHCGESERWWDK